MQERTASSDVWLNGKYSNLDWPEMIRSAHRARSKAVCDMTSNLCRRLWLFSMRFTAVTVFRRGRQLKNRLVR